MFQRRMFSSARIPRSLYGALHIQSAQQASRILPSLVAMPTQSRLVPAGIAQTSLETLRSSQALSASVMLEELIAMMTAEMGMCATMWCKRNLSCLVQVWPRITKSSSMLHLKVSLALDHPAVRLHA